MTNWIKKLTNIDIYKLKNRRIKYFKKIWYIVKDLYNWIKSRELNWDISINKIALRYKLDPRTVKKYFKWFVKEDLRYKNSIRFDDYDLLTIERTIEFIGVFNLLKTKHKKIITFLLYESWIIQNY